jgi:hypothetical protein
VFAENLPDQCPPSTAVDAAWTNVFRLTDDQPVTEESFASHAALGKGIPKSLANLCAWSSCSLTTEPATLKKLKKLRHKFAVKLDIPAGAGRTLKKGIHIDFWRYANFDVLSAVVAVEPL